MTHIDIAAPLLPATTDRVTELEPKDLHTDAASPLVVAQDYARGLAAVPHHLVNRTALAGRVRRMAKQRQLQRTSISLPAGSGRRSGLTAAVRSSLLSGALHVLAAEQTAPVVDEVLAEVRATKAGRKRLGSGGGIRIVCEVSGRPALMRLGKAGTPADPTRHFEGLAAAGGIQMVPDAIECGRLDDVAWSIEARIKGKPSTSIDGIRLTAAVRFLESLPRTDRIVRPFNAAPGLAGIAGDSAPSLMATADRAAEILAGVPGTMIHGDFWQGNLLYRGSDLVAVIDWDGWDDAGAPATDLLHLFADRRRRKAGTGYGAQAAERFWRSAAVDTALNGYLDAVGLTRDQTTIDALGIAWWLTAVANAIDRNPRLRSNRGWMDRNVHQAAAALARDLP